MNKIQYEDESQYQPVYQQAEQKSFFVRLVLATGIVSNDRAAEYVLLGVATLVIIVAIFLSFDIGNQSPPQLPTPFEEGNL